MAGREYSTPTITAIQVSAPTSNAEEAEDLQDLLDLTPSKYVLSIIGDWNAKVGSQGTPGVTGTFGLGVQNEAGQRLCNGKWRKWSGERRKVVLRQNPDLLLRLLPL